MSGVLFLFDVAAIVLIALWLWGVERADGRWRLRLFDMIGQADAEPRPSGRGAPAWRGETAAAERGRDPRAARAGFRPAGSAPVARRPGWRRSV